MYKALKCSEVLSMADLEMPLAAVDTNKRGAENELSKASKASKSRNDELLAKLLEGQNSMRADLTTQFNCINQQLTALNQAVASTAKDVEVVKTEQAGQAKQLRELQGGLLQQQFALNTQKQELFTQGSRKQLILGPVSLIGGDARVTVVDTLVEAVGKQRPNDKPQARNFLEQQVGGVYVLKGGKEGKHKIKFELQSSELFRAVWGAKKHLPKSVYLDPVLTALEMSNKKALWEDPDFKAMRAVDGKKEKKGYWVLDEVHTKWQVGDKGVWVRYHAAYPLGMLANGQPAPPIPEVAAAAAGR